jgi:predicted nucleotidyltransferase
LKQSHRSEYDEETTGRCERALVTVLGSVGLWRERIYLVGGLAPRYIVGQLPEEAEPHIGTTDVDLVIALAVETDQPETYWTLATNLERCGFQQVEPSFRWRRDVDGIPVVVELLGESADTQPGRTFRPREGTGTKLSVLNIPGSNLAAQDFIVVPIERERLDGGGLSRVDVRVANVLPYTVLKIHAFQDRHENKDSYDLVFTLRFYPGGVAAGGAAAAASPIATHPLVREGLQLLEKRFASADLDAPIAYAQFIAAPGDDDDVLRRRQEAVATVRAFLRAFRTG